MVIINTTDMNQSILESLGLSPNEAKIYEALVEKGESSISGIAIAAKVHRRNAYDAIQRLINKGLCFEIFSTGGNLYNAVDPDKLTELSMEKQNELQEIMPDLKRKFQKRLAPEEAYIYRGHEGQKNIWRDVLRIGGNNYIIGAKAGWFDPRLESSRTAFLKEANRKKMKFIQLFDNEVKQQLPNFARSWPGNLEYRYLPKEYSTNSLLHIFGDYIVTYTDLSIGKLSENTVFFVIRSTDLAESYRKWFWAIWKESIKGSK